MPTKPRTAAKAASKLAIAPADTTPGEVQGWDEYLAEAAPDVTSFRKRLPDGDIVEVPCPSSEQVDDLTVAQQQGDVPAMFLAMFGDDLAPTLLELTAKAPFTTRVKLINDVMMHYGMSLAQLPNSATSSNS
jgi:hypothetical protein